MFNEEHTLIVHQGDVQLELFDKLIIPLYPKGRALEIQMEFNGNTYDSSFVVGEDKRITAIGHILEPLSDDEILRAIEQNEIEHVSSDEESNTLLLYIEDNVKPH